MSVPWIAFVCGLIIGAPFGMLALALCVAAARGDEDMPRPSSALKLFCADGHKWYGECLPAVCPVCHKYATGAGQ